MRKASWAAAAAGVVLLVAGCGGEGGSDEGKGSADGSSSAAPAEAGGSLDSATVTKEIADAATAAGFTEKPGDDDIPPALKDCMISWQPDAEKATDSKKSYDDTVATLTKGGWKESQDFEQQGSTIKSLDRNGWTLKASHQGQKGTFVMVQFIATDNGPACEKLFREDLEKNKDS
ncbi:hypothetical protein ACIQ7Q_32480 [Streptomyces sp. NPDC096176]|uniref:hypothetical protein n=1 Tax=Streptomyces sp. NPDC096176 TaxID=3366079 RepID=UPI003808C312